MTRVPAPLLALAAIVSVQLGAAIAKTRFDEVGSVGAAALRLVIGAVVLALSLVNQPAIFGILPTVLNP